MPPNKILWPMGNTGVIWLGIEGAHNWHYFGANGTPSADSIGEWDNCQSNGNGGVGYPGIVNLYGIAFHGKDEWYRIWFDKRDMYSCTEYAVVRWKSCTGNWRTAMFEATNYTTNLDGTTETNPLYDNYVELHGNTYQFDIHLDGLTRYGLWYYQDILSSPEIYAEIWPNSELINNSASRPKRLRCSVVNPKKYVVPNGDATKFYDFDCTLRYKKDSF